MKLLFVLIPVILLLSCDQANAQAGSLAITINGGQSYMLTDKDLLAMKHVKMQLIGQDDKMHKYEGVLLWDILTKAGLPLSTMKKKEMVNMYVTVKASDGYSCLYALAEIDPLFTDKKIMLADKRDGVALPKDLYPYQMVVPGEKKHARWIWLVASIDVVKAH